jgi:hypothetical protein
MRGQELPYAPGQPGPARPWREMRRVSRALVLSVSSFVKPGLAYASGWPGAKMNFERTSHIRFGSVCGNSFYRSGGRK